jgi:DNA-binding MarR family transcriptional regulator
VLGVLTRLTLNVALLPKPKLSTLQLIREIKFRLWVVRMGAYMIAASQRSNETTHAIPLLTNHAYVLALIAQEPDIRMREIALTVGLTERAVQRIVEDLTGTGYIAVTKSGRRNQYVIRADSPLHHPLAKHRNVGELVRFVSSQFAV